MRGLGVLRLRGTGVAAIFVLWTTVAVGMARSDLGFLDARPISYLGTIPETVRLFQVGLVVAAALLTAFAVFVRQAFPVPPSFLLAFLIGQAGQVVTALVPISDPDPAHAVHNIAGIILGLSLPVLMWCFAAGQPAGLWRTTASRLAALETVACVAGVALSASGLALLAEVLPAVAFHLWIAVVTAATTAGPATKRGR